MLTPRDGLLGWATGRLIEHDARAPGAIRRLLASSPGRRQAIFALLAAELASERQDQIVGVNDEDAATRRSEIIRDGGARDVMVELLGREPPDGLRGALERLGLNPMPDARLYGRLIEIFTDPSAKIAAEALALCRADQTGNAPPHRHPAHQPASPQCADPPRLDLRGPWPRRGRRVRPIGQQPGQRCSHFGIGLPNARGHALG